MRAAAAAAAGVIGLVLAGAALPGSAAAQPTVEIRHAAARVIVYPEPRGDVTVSVQAGDRRLGVTISRLGDRVIVDGGLGLRAASCRGAFGRRGVGVFGLGDVPYERLPVIVVHSPLDVRVSAGSAVFGVINRSRSLEFANAGCGDWTIANVAGHARISQSGSGDSRVGSVGAADVSIAGSGDVRLQAIGGGLNASTSGSGDVAAASIMGDFNARVAGSGNIKVAGGRAPAMRAQVAGSGDVSFGGLVGRLDASVAGSGDVRVRAVSGPIAKHVAGSGEVIVGS